MVKLALIKSISNPVQVATNAQKQQHGSQISKTLMCRGKYIFFSRNI